MSRFARERRVFFIEEPIYGAGESELVTKTCPQTGVHVVTPHLVSHANQNQVLEELIAEFISSNSIQKPILWFYTPMALGSFPSSISTSAVIYDCMDELSMFRGAPPGLRDYEQQLFNLADLVFTGGVSLCEAKRDSHPSVHAFPSGVDFEHFAQARALAHQSRKRRDLPGLRLGYAGVIDERLDLPLLDEVAGKKPEWQFVMIGPTAKISPDSLPRRENIHWLGMKDYSELPEYFAGWDVGMMPFALNDATRFISPTKTPEYLSAGLPVVSTAIRDVVNPYGKLGLAWIASDADEFIRGSELAASAREDQSWQERADTFLQGCSWDAVWEGMSRHVMSVRTPARPMRSPVSTVNYEIQEQIASV